jgi:hypothetical protein
MPDTDTTLEGDEMIVRDEPVEVTASVVPNDDAAPTEDRPTRNLVIRQVLERQLVAGQGLSTDLIEAAIDATVALAHSPAIVVNEIRSGADLPSALARTGAGVREAVAEASERVRAVVGGYVVSQATLPNAVIAGTADVAETIVRAQGIVTTSALHTAFTLATVAAQGGDVRDAFARERTGVQDSIDVGRDRITASVTRARDEIRSAIKDYDTIADAFGDR